MSSKSFTPASQRRFLRACMVCGVVRPYSSFLAEGCPNCEEYLQLKGSSESIHSCTSTLFESLMTLAKPKESWAAKFLRNSNNSRDMYAVQVLGKLPDEVAAMLAENGVPYVPRDGSAVDVE